MTTPREIQASEAKAHLAQLLDDVEHGETIIITRHGKPIARLAPETENRQAEIRAAIEGMRALKGRMKNHLSLEEILSSRHEGHRF